MKTLKVVLLLVFLSSAASSALAQQLTFSFINPSFGGSPLNASWLMQSAQVQSDYKQKEASTTDKSDSELDEFAKNLNNQILYSLSNAIIQKQFGTDNKLKEGVYNIGKYRINIGSGSGGVTVTIFDNSTGNQTQVTVPNY
ncbi:curli assembly protein CsgF [uncultured Acetobacteroides sp.]|uniref:curli assembly protein CsgF n=1 Tax=uncultured Acetobacteroides sp. TaxID=1760811 RepID=UPI0029F4C7CE|nr:curli assembly protein CsgF [uncultured Acetobacteroides sp.]